MMFPVTSMAAFGGHRALFHTPPGGTCLRIISLRMHRCSGGTNCLSSNGTSRCQGIHHSTRRFAATMHPVDTISTAEFDLFRDLLSERPKPRDIVSMSRSLDMNSAHIDQSPFGVTVEQLPNPFQKALKALQQRDTRRLLIYLQQISLMSSWELQDAVAKLPRTSFTEFLRALDPLVVAHDADPTDQMHISAGMYQTLNLGSVLDNWGVRKLYVRLLRSALALVTGLKASGRTIQLEEYVYLLRCAGAASDPAGAKWLWDEMVRTGIANWRQSELYSEYVSARFLTRPLNRSYDKTRVLVQPRDLHRARIRLDTRRVIWRLERLRFNVRLKRLYFGLNKDVAHTEDIMRILRKNRPPTKLFFKVQYIYDLNESLLCALMVAFGRAGSLRFIGSRILHNYFGIKMKKLTYSESANSQAQDTELQIDQDTFKVRPTVRLMHAVVETYGSNAEIITAIRLVLHISGTFQIPIPLSIWQALLEWAYVTTSPPISTAWKLSNMRFKIPQKHMVELIWNAMISYNIEPGFEQYNVFIRNLISRNQISKILDPMREAVKLYDAQCQEYEDAVFEYVQMLRDGVRLSETIHRYERARFKKGKMWLDINTWCRQFLANMRAFEHHKSLVTVFVPEFIEEFRNFIPNPLRYRTAAGYINMVDPARESQLKVNKPRLPAHISMRWGGRDRSRDVRLRKYAGRSSYALGGHVPVAKIGLLTLLTSTSRHIRKREGMPADAPQEENLDGSAADNTYDDDDELF